MILGDIVMVLTAAWWSRRRLGSGVLTAAVSLLAVTLATDAVQADPPTVHVVPPGIAADCSADTTAALNSFIASVPNGSTAAPNVISFKPKGCYLISTGVKLEHRRGLVLAGNGAMIFRKHAIPPWARARR